MKTKVHWVHTLVCTIGYIIPSMYFLQSWGQSGLNTDVIFLWINPQENRYEIIPNPISTRKGENHAALDTAPDSPSSGSIPFPSQAGATVKT